MASFWSKTNVYDRPGRPAPMHYVRFYALLSSPLLGLICEAIFGVMCGRESTLVSGICS